ncbi:MAG: uroporphyrinogen decarboxylase family protein [Thermodesulfobacteriota bacterium]
MTALSGGIPDQVPLFLRDLTLGLEVAGFSTPEVCAGGPNGGYDAKKSAYAVVASWEKFRPDAVVGSIHDLGADVEALGGKVDFPMHGVPRIVAEPFADKNRLISARIPRMDEDGRLPGVLKSHELVKERIGAEAAVCANLEGPITKAANLRGTEKLMRDFFRDPGFAMDLINFSTEISISHIRFLSQAGADFVFVAAATDGPVIVAPKIFLEYTIPNLKRMVQTASEAGLKLIFHPHGRFTDTPFQHLVDHALETGIAGFQFPENCDLGLAKILWGGKTVILGGIDVPTILIPGPLDKIRHQVRLSVSQASAGGGYIFMPSCSLHRGYPLNHIKSMVDAVGRFGKYPADVQSSFRS